MNSERHQGTARDQVRSARELLSRAQDHILRPSPAELDAACVLLEQAGARMTVVCDALRTGAVLASSDFHRQLESFRQDLAQAVRLMLLSAAFYDGWLACRNRKAAGYGNGGSAAATPPQSRIAIRA